MAQHHQYPPQTTPYSAAVPPQYPPQQPPEYAPHPPHQPPPPPYLSHLHQPPPQPLHHHHFPYHNHYPYDYAAAYNHHPPPPPTRHHHYPPPPYPSSDHHHRAYSDDRHPRRRHPSKRRREAPVGDVVEEAAPSTKRQAVVVGNDVLFRVVVPSGEIGKVIGKGGHRVQKIRDDTKATVKIADPIARYEERVVIISSKEKSDGGMTDAEKALLQIASLILVEDGSTSGGRSGADNPYDASNLAPNAVKLLITGSQAGGLIGVSGQNIEKLRMSSGAAIAVLSPTQLPMCASAHESDRLVQVLSEATIWLFISASACLGVWISLSFMLLLTLAMISGETSEVLKALEEIGVELRANPPKQVISISPMYNLSVTRAAQPYMDPDSAECVTLDMVISETMVGGLIGRNGSNIGRIRNESGAMIKVFGGKGEQKHRQIQLIGSAQQVALAKQRVDEYVYTQLTQPSTDD